MTIVRTVVKIDDLFTENLGEKFPLLSQSHLIIKNRVEYGLKLKACIFSDFTDISVLEITKL